MNQNSIIKNMKIGIVGGSIAGCSAAILLGRLGAEVSVLERASHMLLGKGAGIVLPENLIQQCIHLDLFDNNIPPLPISTRTLTVKDEKFDHSGKQIWQQPIDVVALNWSDVYFNLYKRIPNNSYCYKEEIISASETNNICHVETSQGKKYTFDLLIAADGIDSIVRKKILPQYSSDYTGYVAWRGVTNMPELGQYKIPEGFMPCYVYKNGHLLIYPIPASDYQTSGTKLLNWLIYEEFDSNALEKLLVDNNGIKHSASLPPRSLTAEHLKHLKQFSDRVLPRNIAEIIHKTEKPFLQIILDGQVPHYAKSRICFVGDAATILRPHSGSGVLKSINDSINLSKILECSEESDLVTALQAWDVSQKTIAHQQVSLAKTLGNALVTNTPPWEKMDFEIVDEWWKSIMTGREWYATRQQLK